MNHTFSQEDFIEIYGARVHNLKNIDLKIPREKLVVLTGLSGSGKSSLAFDTLYAEGQRRYLESFSAYARQFIGGLERPDVDKITGLSPVIAIEQKTTSRNPRSTVGTVTEIYDFLRLLYARAGEAYSYASGKKMEKLSDDEIVKNIRNKFGTAKIQLLAPLVRGRKGHYRELFEQIRKQGYGKVRVDGQLYEVTPNMMLDRYKVHNIEVVIDRIPAQQTGSRLSDSVKTALGVGKGLILVMETDGEEETWYSRSLMDPESGISYEEPAPNTFSFNSPYGACPECKGLGYVPEVDENALVSDPSLSILRGALAPIGEYREIWIFNELKKIAKKLNIKLTTPYSEIPIEAQRYILEGPADYTLPTPGTTQFYGGGFPGIKNYVKHQFDQSESENIRAWAEEFMKLEVCPVCQGSRLKKESVWFKIGGKNIYELACMDLVSLQEWFESLEPRLKKRQVQIAGELIREINKRIGFLTEVGLGYLNLNRPAKSLSGGEAQRIRLATQIGSSLTGVLYILDEPSIGLHQRDNQKLIKALTRLRDLGNSVLVVEHDKDMMMAADHIVDIGPGAGIHGGRIIAEGPPALFMLEGSPTADFLSGKRKIPVPESRRSLSDKHLTITGATGNNLKSVQVDIPLGLFVCITGVSGSGKSTLVNETLFPILSQNFYDARKKPLAYKKVKGLEHLDKVIEIDQSPIGRTPRSNPATYTGLFTHIRDFYAELTEAKIRGYKSGRFSFNVKGGRCEDCQGAGVKTIEMNFLPDVYVECETCRGKRYNRETLEVRYKGKSINDVLNMTVSEALPFFEALPRIANKIRTLEDVGLGYITLGQQATTLSGGEAQRVKIATELCKKDTGKTMYILDEPTTGLHFQDIEKLLEVLQKLVGKGNTILVVEHNLDVIKVADWIIDMGPDGGQAGGKIIATGTPEEVAHNPDSITGYYLKAELAEALV
ncbi:MAG: excinuclease ABC subunit UvrA [Sphingobacteriia bacterium]|nr:excinuclease ABC subunit UvrA [Sphingobacteriia bacterium]